MYSKLYDEKVVATKEYLEKKYAYEQARASYQAAIAGQQSHWQEDLSRLRLESRQWQAGKKQLQKEKEQCWRSGRRSAGTMQQFSGRYAGGSVQSGELLGYISPDSGLWWPKSYVSPHGYWLCVCRDGWSNAR
jgi:multidrug resistance efflux pump